MAWAIYGDGCSVEWHCLSCSLPLCRYDIHDAEVVGDRLRGNLIRFAIQNGAQPEELARMFKVSVDKVMVILNGFSPCLGQGQDGVQDVLI